MKNLIAGIVENSMTSSSSDHDSSASLPSPPKQALMDDDFVKTLEQLSKQVRLIVKFIINFKTLLSPWYIINKSKHNLSFTIKQKINMELIETYYFILIRKLLAANSPSPIMEGTCIILF